MKKKKIMKVKDLFEKDIDFIKALYEEFYDKDIYHTESNWEEFVDNVLEEDLIILVDKLKYDLKLKKREINGN